MMTPEEYISLYEKYRSGSCTPEEEKLLMEFHDHFQLQEEESVVLSPADKALRARIYGRIVQTTTKRKVFPITWRWAAAAVIMLAAGSGAWLLPGKQAVKQVVVKSAPVNNSQPIKPGTNTATLTLANGSTILLEDAADGVVAQTGNTAVTKVKKGLLTYSVDGQAIADAHAMHTINIPRGGQYAVTLADGTKVWLNSESSLTYPVVFNGAERKVTLKGEAYFEVSKDEQKPFVVNTDNAAVQVLGTHFNINAYKDEKHVRATLLEGSIRLSAGTNNTLLAPGEQGIVDILRAGIKKERVNVNQVMAWKAGYFIFRNNTIQDIMRQIGRWYDVEVEYRGAIPTGTFGGTYSRNKDIKELLEGLELTGLVHFKIEGRRLIVMT